MFGSVSFAVTADAYARFMGRFSEPQDPAFAALNTSLAFDRRLWPQDVAGSWNNNLGVVNFD